MRRTSSRRVKSVDAGRGSSYIELNSVSGEEATEPVFSFPLHVVLSAKRKGLFEADVAAISGSLDWNEEVVKQDSLGRNVLHLAVGQLQHNELSFLLSHCDGVSLYHALMQQDGGYITPLQAALQKDIWSVVIFLQSVSDVMERSHLIQDSSVEDGSSLIHGLVKKMASQEMAAHDLLLFKLKHYVCEGMLPSLIEAFGTEDTIKLLKRCDRNGETFFHAAAAPGLDRILTDCLAMLAPEDRSNVLSLPDGNGRSVLHRMYQHASFDLVQRVVDGLDVHEVSRPLLLFISRGESALYRAVHQRDIPLFEYYMCMLIAANKREEIFEFHEGQPYGLMHVVAQDYGVDLEFVSRVAQYLEGDEVVRALSVPRYGDGLWPLDISLMNKDMVISHYLLSRLRANLSSSDYYFFIAHACHRIACIKGYGYFAKNERLAMTLSSVLLPFWLSVDSQGVSLDCNDQLVLKCLLPFCVDLMLNAPAYKNNALVFEHVLSRRNHLGRFLCQPVFSFREKIALRWATTPTAKMQKSLEHRYESLLQCSSDDSDRAVLRRGISPSSSQSCHSQ